MDPNVLNCQLGTRTRRIGDSSVSPRGDRRWDGALVGFCEYASRDPLVIFESCHAVAIAAVHDGY